MSKNTYITDYSQLKDEIDKQLTLIEMIKLQQGYPINWLGKDFYSESELRIEKEQYSALKQHKLPPLIRLASHCNVLQTLNPSALSNNMRHCIKWNSEWRYGRPYVTLGTITPTKANTFFQEIEWFIQHLHSETNDPRIIL